MWDGFVGLVAQGTEKAASISCWRGRRAQGNIMLMTRQLRVTRYGCCNIRNFRPFLHQVFLISRGWRDSDLKPE
jgi:hypothetical protein